jgi:hypothetical protein
VGHGDERAANVGEAEDRFQEIPVIPSLDAHRHDDSVDARLLEIGVVDQRRFECLGWVADMCDQGCTATDHSGLLAP